MEPAAPDGDEAYASPPPRGVARRLDRSLLSRAHSGLRRSIDVKSFVAAVKAMMGVTDVSAEVKTVPPPGIPAQPMEETRAVKTRVASCAGVKVKP